MLLAPWALGVGALTAGGLIMLHAITVGRPRPAWLPTARFAPDRAPRAERRLARPVDHWLLAIRVLAALLAALGLARPIREPERKRIARVVLADVADPTTRAAVRDSARTLVGPGDALVAFAAAPATPLVTPIRPARSTVDSAARRARLDSALAGSSPGTADVEPTSLSAALVAARRIAPTVAAGADSIELVIVSPFSREMVDPATAPLRATWTGRARLVRVNRSSVAHPVDARPAVAMRGGPTDDALAASLALAGVTRDDAAPVRIVRGTATAADSTWATLAAHVLVEWPAAGLPAAGLPAAGLPSGAARALVAGGRVALGAFGRDSTGGATADAPRARVRARWADGAPAVVDQRAGIGCVRAVGVRVPQAGDLALRPDFLAMLPGLIGPCTTARDFATLAPADLARLAGAGPLLAAARLRAPASSDAPDPLGAALLAAAAALLVAELPLRRVLRRPAEGDAPLVAAPATGGMAAASPRAAAA